MTDLQLEQVEGWRAVAAGWERQRDVLTSATAVLSQRMLERLAPRPGQKVLELAAGPGETGFLAAPLLRPGGSLLSTDAAPEMVEVARRRADELGLNNVSFAVEDAAALSLADDAFDAVLCRFGLMLVPAMDRAAAETARVLRPGGRAVFAVWASPALNPWITTAAKAALELGLLEPPEDDAPGPFRLADDARLRAVLGGGGLTVTTVEDVMVDWRARSLVEWWETVLDTSRVMSTLLAGLSPDRQSALRQRSEELLSEYVESDGSLVAPGVARIAVAEAPES